MKKLLAIIGPTASGKSGLALAIARQANAEILSVDSMQVYRGMNIGTAKPTMEDQSAVRHHLIDVVDANESFTVARFVELADGVIMDCRRRGVPLIVTGGTPLYYKSLFEGLFEGPAADLALRDRLRAQAPEELAAKLLEVDPAAASRIHVNDTKRMIRALEVYELTGRPISSFQTEWGAGQLRHDACWIGLEWDKDALNRRINARVKAMLAEGWVEEARTLLERFGGLSSTAAEATGYRLLMEHVRGKITLDDAAEQIKIATRQLARRQVKWFRRFAGVTWLAGDKPVEENLTRSLAIWKGS